MNNFKKSIIANMCFVLAITLSVCWILYTLNYVALAFEYQITTVLCGTGAKVDDEALQEANKKGREVAIQIGEEGFTLLRNQENALPLKEDELKVSVFGRGGSDKNFWYMGIGSGAGPSAGRVTLYDGLEEAGLTVNPKLKAKYNALPSRTTAYSDSESGLNHVTAYELFEPSVEWLKADGMLDEAIKDYPTAIVVIGRGGSEDGDYDKYQTFTDDNGKEVLEKDARKDTTRKYNEISEQEEQLLSTVRQLFDKVIVVINSANVMELGFLEKYNVDAAINMYYPGNYGTIALGNLLTGKANPSGKTVDTFAYDISTAPAYVNAGRKDYYTNSGIRYTDYAEGIYVGYKWYETAYAESFWKSAYAQKQWGYYATADSDAGYNKVVQYPFGFGLSYTSFDWKVTEVSFSEGSSADGLNKDAKIKFTVYVTNTGNVIGQDVVQLYCTPPFTDGGIEKSAVNLAAFAKTSKLVPLADGGKGEFVTLEVSLYDLASYDCYDKNNNGFMGYEIEKGNYTFSLRTDAHTLKETDGENEYTYQVLSDYTYPTDPVTGNTVENRFTTFTAESGANSSRQEHEPAIGTKTAYSIDGGEEVLYLSRTNFAQTYPKHSGRDMQEIARNSSADSTPAINADDVMPTTDDSSVTYQVSDIIKVKKDENGNVVPNKSKPKLDENGNPVLDESGNPTYEPQYYIDENVLDVIINRLSVNDMYNMIAAGSSSSLNAASSIGFPGRLYKDGPSGISGTFVGAGESEFTTNFPCEVVIASTWNWFLAYQMGLSVGSECAATSTAGWYGPACNLHRDPLGGRNYEYYSEDSFLSGIMCAYTVRGAKEQGIICWVKHIAANDDEIARVGKYTWMTEQSFRETYLLPFRITVQTGGANGMMAAFNRIGSVKAGSSYALMTEVLRDEWGFKGAVITDAYAADRNDPDECIRAGVDVLLSWGTSVVTNWDDKTSATAVKAMQKSCKNMLISYIDCRYTALMADSLTSTSIIGEDLEIFAWWKVVLFVFDGLAVAALAAWCAFTAVSSVKKLKKAQA